MKIQIKELGAIKEAKIDLDKPISLFCGQNNTGKTYLAFVIYALTREKIGRNPLEIDIAKLMEKGTVEIDINSEQIYQYKIDTLGDIKTNLDTVFGISEETAQQIFSLLEIEFLSDKQTCLEKIESTTFDDNVSIGAYKFRVIKELKKSVLEVQIIDGHDYTNILKDPFYSLRITSHLISRIAFYPISKAVIFPVERNSIFTFSRELSISRNLLVEQMQKLSVGEKLDPFEMLQGGSNRYPLAIRDGLSVSNDLVALSNRKSDFFDIATEIEQSLLNGTLQIEKKDGSVAFVSNKKKSKRLPIHMSASIVKTLSSVVFYLKYSAERNDLIIIDEPEMNLHPDNQIILTKVFAKLYNKGFRLLISTHSDYIIREFNNLIMANSIKSTDDKNLVEMYNEDEKISPNDVGVYYFHFPKSSVSQVSVKTVIVENTGFEVESIDKEINDQNERSMSLYYELTKTNK